MRAFIAIGHERRFALHADQLIYYLRAFSKNSRRRVIIRRVPLWDRDQSGVEAALMYQALTTGRSPFLVAYFGHGYRDGWSYGLQQTNDTLQFPYKSVAETLRHRSGPTLVLNDCCHAAALEDHLTWVPGDRAPISLISACGAEQVSHGEMIGDVLDSWKLSTPYEPMKRRLLSPTEHVQERRWGVQLDHHFFHPKP